MFYTYILKSSKDLKYYYGYTANLELRLREHKYGKVKATKNRRPLTLHYFESFLTKSEAFGKRKIFQMHSRLSFSKGK